MCIRCATAGDGVGGGVDVLGVGADRAVWRGLPHSGCGRGRLGSTNWDRTGLSGSALAEVMAATAAGDYPAAERAWERYAPMAAVGPEADAFVHAMLGLVQLARGALSAACVAFRDSISAMSHGFPRAG